MSRLRLLFSTTAAFMVFVAVVATAQPPASERPTITVAAFEFVTVATVQYADYRSRRRYDQCDDRPAYGSAFAEALGTGAAGSCARKTRGP